MYLCDLKQWAIWSSVASLCCELVSKFCIFVIWNSFVKKNIKRVWLWIGFKILYLCDLKQLWNEYTVYIGVVNWFQNFVSLWSETVYKPTPISPIRLWIGFKILYLCDLKQLQEWRKWICRSCELVSKFCIFVIWNSYCLCMHVWKQVVNWFQNFVSLWSETVCD